MYLDVGIRGLPFPAAGVRSLQDGQKTIREPTFTAAVGAIDTTVDRSRLNPCGGRYVVG